MTFESNQGQAESSILALSRAHGYALLLRKNEAIFNFYRSSPHLASTPRPSAAALPDEAFSLSLAFFGANDHPTITFEDPQLNRTNYLLGNDPARWHTDLANYGKVHDHGLYRGIDLVYYGNNTQMEHDFLIAPYADPALIRMKIEGASKLSLRSNGSVEISTHHGVITLHRPDIYQRVRDRKYKVQGGFAVLGSNRLAFRIGSYDHARPLIIDPVLTYSTYLGGTASDSANSIAIDDTGSAYITGATQSIDFPTTTSSQGTGTPATRPVAFVSKLSPDGASLIYSTFIGGTAHKTPNDSGNGIAVDATGNAYVVGTTYSTDFPTMHPLQSTNKAAPAGGSNVFIAKLNPPRLRPALLHLSRRLCL